MNELKLATYNDRKETDQSWEAWIEGEEEIVTPIGFGPTEQAAKTDLVVKLEANIDQLNLMIKLVSQP